MRTVYQVFWTPPDIYRGGIAKILDDYFNNEILFQEHGYVLKRFNYQIEQSIFDCIPIIGSKIRNIRYMISQKRALLKEIRSHKDSIIHIQTSRKWTFFRDILLARGVKKKQDNGIIMTVHYAEITEILYSNSIIRKAEIRLLNKYVDQIICLGNSILNEFISAGVKADKCKILNTFHHFDLKAKPVKTYDPFKLIFMGSLDQRKGILDLLKVMEELDQYPDIVLEICGGKVSEDILDSYQLHIESLQNRVHENGYISGHSKLKMLTEANVFVLPSYGEGMPVVLMEAMATACGIITTSVGCIPEIISYSNGIIVNPGKINELKDAVIRLYCDRQMLTEMENKNFEASKSFTVSKNIELLCGIYDEV